VAAAIPPKAPNRAVARIGTSHINKKTGAKIVVTTGTAAPIENEAAE
jgi:hypothetical protein